MKTILLLLVTIWIDNSYSAVESKRSLMVLYKSKDHYNNFNVEKFDVHSFCSSDKNFEHCSERVIAQSILYKTVWDVCFIETDKIRSPHLVDFVMKNCREIE